MKAKKERKHYAAQWTEDGLPRDANAWTVEDWIDLYRGLEAIKKKIADRHRKEREKR